MMNDEEAIAVLRLLEWEDGPRVSIFGNGADEAEDAEEEDHEGIGNTTRAEDVPAVMAKILNQLEEVEEEEDGAGGEFEDVAVDDEVLDQRLDQVLAEIARSKLQSDDVTSEPVLGSLEREQTLCSSSVKGVFLEISTAALRQWNVDMRERQTKEEGKDDDEEPDS